MVRKEWAIEKIVFFVKLNILSYKDEKSIVNSFYFN